MSTIRKQSRETMSEAKNVSHETIPGNRKQYDTGNLIYVTSVS